MYITQLSIKYNVEVAAGGYEKRIDIGLHLPRKKKVSSWSFFAAYFTLVFSIRAATTS